MMDKQIKSRERAASHGEVFTADKFEILDLSVGNETA